MDVFFFQRQSDTMSATQIAESHVQPPSREVAEAPEEGHEQLPELESQRPEISSTTEPFTVSDNIF